MLIKEYNNKNYSDGVRIGRISKRIERTDEEREIRGRNGRI